MFRRAGSPQMAAMLEHDRPASPEEVTTATTIERLVHHAAAAGGVPAVIAHLAVDTGGRRRDLLLGGRTAIDAAVAVIDWHTAPLAGVFFRHAPGDVYELAVDDRTLTGTVVARHLVATAHGHVVAIRGDEITLTRRDDGWIAHATAPPPAPPDRPAPIGRAALPELDPAQRAAVELPAGRSLVVDGEAGVGKTLVGMYRIAHLLRAAAARGRRLRALVLVPTEGLRRLCAVLADRLDIAVEIAIVDDWLVARARAAFPGLPDRVSTDATAGVIRFKRHPAVRAALEPIVARRHRHDREDPLSRARADLRALFGDRVLLERIVAAADGALGAVELAQVAAHTRVQFTDPLEQQLRHVDADRLVTVDRRRLDDGTPLGDAGTFDVEDAPVLFELARRRGVKLDLPRYDHVLVDEAQRVAPMELAAIAGAVRPGGSITLAGDHRQDTDESAAFAGWDAAIAELGVRDPARVTLAVGYRSTAAIAAFARAVVEAPPAAPVADPSLVMTAHAGELAQVAALCEAIDAAMRRAPWQQVAVVCRNPDHARRVHRQLGRGVDAALVLTGDFTFEPGVVVTTVAQIQGLEFDAVVVPDLTEGFYPAGAEVQRALYVALTRARDWLWVTTAAAWSPLVAGPAPAAW